MAGIFAMICDKIPQNITGILKNITQEKVPDIISSKCIVKSDCIYVSRHFYQNEPYTFDGKVCLCIGTISNAEHLILKHCINCDPDQQCKLILNLYMQTGIENTYLELKGQFAFIIIDQNTVYIARDRYGICPLYYGLDDKLCCLTIASSPQFLRNSLCVNTVTKGVCVKHIKNSEQFVENVCMYTEENSEMTSDELYEKIQNNMKDITPYPKTCCFSWEGKRCNIIQHFLPKHCIKVFTHNDVEFSLENLSKIVQKIISIIPTQNIDLIRNAVLLYAVKDHIDKDTLIISGLNSECATATHLLFPQNPITFPLLDGHMTEDDIENINLDETACEKAKHIWEKFSEVISEKIPDEIFDHTRYESKESMYYSLIREKIWGKLSIK